MFEDILGNGEEPVECKECGKTIFKVRAGKNLPIEYYICPECYNGVWNV
jgi:uncharacterized protein YlaI